MAEDWEKTVLTAKEAAIIQFPILKSAVGVKWEDYLKARHNKVLKAQAKASWEVAYQAGIAKGRQEVAEWLKTKQMPDKPSSEPYPGLVAISKVQFEAKLKEWGVMQKTSSRRLLCQFKGYSRVISGVNL